MSHLPHSPACDLLGCRLPIFLAGMGGVSRGELVAAVSAAGGFGFLGMVREDPTLIVAEVEEVRRLGHQRFGVNLIPAATDPSLLDAQVATCIALEVPVVATFWDLDEWLVERLRLAGIVVVHQVGSVEEAIAAERAGVQVVIAQGREAGGHVRGVRPLAELLPDVVAAVSVPVLAAGGLSTGRDLVTALALGADGVLLGTALMATEESFAHDYHKRRLVEASTADTVLTDAFHINWPPHAPVRVLRNSVTRRSVPAAEGPRRIIGEEAGRPIYMFSTDSPLRNMSGDFEAMALYAGTGVSSIRAIVPAEDRIASIVREAVELLYVGLADLLPAEPSSAVCYVGEVTGGYMGHVGETELAFDMRSLDADLSAALQTVHVQNRSSDEAAPPFVSETAAYAAWILKLRAAAGTTGTMIRRPPPDADLHLIRAALKGRVTSLVGRLPEGRLRATLSAFREWLTSRPGGTVPAASNGERLVEAAPDKVEQLRASATEIDQVH